MSEQHTATPASSGSDRPASAKGGLRVGRHVGQTAGEAAQAIRRAGLRPGVERCFGYPEEKLGQVVEQDPPAGTELTRNGLVRIFVAAPGGEPAEEQPDDGDADATVAWSDTPHEAEASEPVEPAPDPLEVEAVEPSTGPVPTAVQAGRDEADGAQTGAPKDVSTPAPSEDELVALAERVFAEQMARDARRPRKARARSLLEAARERLTRWRRRSLLVKAAWLMLALWLTVGVLTALLGGRGSAPGTDRRPRVVREAPRSAGLPTRPDTTGSAGSVGHARRPGRRTGSQAGRVERAAVHARTGEQGRRAGVRGAARLGMSGGSAAAGQTTPVEVGSPPVEVESPPAEAQAPVVTSGPAGPGVVVPAPPEQTGGGPFSP